MTTITIRITEETQRARMMETGLPVPREHTYTSDDPVVMRSALAAGAEVDGRGAVTLDAGNVRLSVIPADAAEAIAATVAERPVPMLVRSGGEDSGAVRGDGARRGGVMSSNLWTVHQHAQACCWFLDETDIASLAADDRTRLLPILVRCGGCRFTCGAQDVAHLVGIVDRSGEPGAFPTPAGGDYVRDVSLPAESIAQLRRIIDDEARQDRRDAAERGEALPDHLAGGPS